MRETSGAVALLGLFDPPTGDTRASSVQRNAFRLDASSYAGGASDNLTALGLQHATAQVGKLARVFGFGPFRRTYITLRQYGIPLLSSSEMMQYAPEPPILAKIDCPKWEQYQVERGWILVSCSGTIGNVALVAARWGGWAVSQHAIRIVPDSQCRGLIYFFVTLPAVKAALLSRKSGSVIDEIYADDVASLECPIVVQPVLSQLNELYDKVLDARDAAGRTYDDALAEAVRVNALPSLKKGATEGIEPDRTKDAWVTTDIILAGAAYRLDAHYYNPEAGLALANIGKCPSKVETVGQVTKQIRMSPLFVRKYVSKEHGVPYIAGKQISQIRPEFKYISRSATEDLDEHILHEGWTLVTCAGTIGKVGYVSGALVGAAAQDVMRVIPDEAKVDGGYLNAWLASEYGRVSLVRCRYGSVVDRISPQHVGSVLIPLPSVNEQRAIGERIRQVYQKRAEAIRLEDEAQTILMRELTKAPVREGA